MKIGVSRIDPGVDESNAHPCALRQLVGGRYSKTKVLTDFMAILPADQPHYLLLIMLDEPHTTPETHGFTTSGWNAVPTGGAVVARIAPLLDIAPRMDLPPADQQILATLRESR